MRAQQLYHTSIYCVKIIYPNGHDTSGISPFIVLTLSPVKRSTAAESLRNALLSLYSVSDLLVKYTTATNKSVTTSVERYRKHAIRIVKLEIDELITCVI
jgi:hypothetical protein